MVQQSDPRTQRRLLLAAAKERALRLRASEQDHYERTRQSCVWHGMELGRVRATAETEAKLRPDPIVRLVANETLTREQGHAAVEIREIYERIGGALFGRASDLAERSRGARREVSDRITWLHATRYLPWARHMGGDPPRGPNEEARPGRLPPALPVAIDAAVFQMSLRSIDRREMWRDGTAAALLRYALRLYCDIAGWERNRPAIAAAEEAFRRAGVAAIEPLG
jgi:histone H3/H4